MPNTDKTIMEKISSKNQGAFEILSKKHGLLIGCKILSMLKEKSAADGTHQDVFIRKRFWKLNILIFNTKYFRR